MQDLKEILRQIVSELINVRANQELTPYPSTKLADYADAKKRATVEVEKQFSDLLGKIEKLP